MFALILPSVATVTGGIVIDGTPLQLTVLQLVIFTTYTACLIVMMIASAVEHDDTYPVPVSTVVAAVFNY